VQIRATGRRSLHSGIQLGNHSGSHPGGRPQGGLGVESVIDPQNDSSSDSNSHSCNDLGVESVTESAGELWNQPLSEPESESAGQSEIDSRVESASHSQDESAGESQNDSWNDLPDADPSAGSISVRRLVLRSDSHATRSSGNCRIAVRDVEGAARLCGVTEDGCRACCAGRKHVRHAGLGRRMDSCACCLMRPEGDSAWRSQVSFRRSLHRNRRFPIVD